MDRKVKFCHWLKLVASNWSKIWTKLCWERLRSVQEIGNISVTAGSGLKGLKKGEYSIKLLNNRGKTMSKEMTDVQYLQSL